MSLKSPKLRYEPTGVQPSLPLLLQAREHCLGLHPGRSSPARSLLSGGYRTHFRGRGLEFEEVREYQAGDDIRAIDWRVSARSGKTYTKLFREERERPVFLLVEQSQQMAFGSQRRFKQVTAASTAALLAWAALHDGDRVGGMILRDQHCVDLRPQRRAGALLHWLQQLACPEPSGTPSPGGLLPALQQLRRVLRPGSALFLIVDWASLDASLNSELYWLSQHHDIACIAIYDALEQELPPADGYAISDGQHTRWLDTRQAQRRQQYRQQFDQRWEQHRQALGRLGIPLLGLRNDAELLPQLQQFMQNHRSQPHGQR